MKLSSKLAGLFMAISILTVAGVGVLAFQSSRRSLEAKVFEDLAKTTLLKEAELERWLLNNEQDLEKVAQRPLVKQYAATLASLQPDDPAYQEAYQQLDIDHLPLLIGTGGYLTISILRPSDGQILISTDKSLEGFFRENETYFLKGQSQTYTQTPAYSLVDNGVVMHTSTPILSKEGDLIAVLVGHQDLGEMSRIMEQGRELTATEETYLVNQFGFLVTNSRFGVTSPLRVTVNSPGVNDCLTGTSATTIYNDYRDVPVLGSYRWLPNLALCILTEIDQQEALAPVVSLRQKMLWLGILAIVVASGAGIFFSRSLTKSLRQLTVGMEIMAAGNLDHRVQVDRQDELGTLANGFNQMAASLETIQAALSDSESKYRAVVEGADAAISTIAHDGTFLFMNTNAARQLGGQPDDFVGQRMADLLPKQVSERQLESIRTVIAGNASLVIEAPSEVAGQTRWFNSRIQPVRDGEDQTTAALLIAYDITPQKEAEMALVEERSFVDAIMDTAEALIIGLDNEGHIMRFNWACEALTGYSFGEVAGRPFWDFLLLEEEKEEIKKVFHQMQAGDFPNTHENYWLTKSGERRAIAWANTCQLDTLGKVKYVIGTGIDITKQKQTEAELIQLNQTLEQRVADRTEEVVQSEKRFRAAFDLAAIGRVLATPEGQFFQVNQAFCEMTGYSEEELCQKTWWDITHPDFLASGHDYMQQLIQRTIPSYNEELTIAHKSGDTIWVRLNRILLFNADNQPLYLVSDIENITQRKTAEAEINRILAELERSNIELQQFAYVASHDLQEPLRMVTSYLQLLQRRYSGKLDSDADEFIGYAVDGANRMKQLIQDLLSFSRVGTRGKPFEPVEIKVILKEALTNLETSIQETAAQIDHDDLLPTITGDAGQLVQLFQNLLSNAIKFRGEAPPKIHIGVQKQESDWQFSIRDNGIGFDPQFSDRIFIIFQRLHTRANYGGTGIGLAICKKIVERHGGNIWVHSQPNAGTTFYFTIPANTIQKAEL
ncbi:MAG: PAS domain S-box protein [Chloroflexi bacterium]|nr:PAS domain S-box protein [Chloroflexota bacterium]